MTVLVVNGPSLNLLGTREPHVYGPQTLQELEAELTVLAERLEVSLRFFQANSEGAIIDFIHEAGFEAEGLIINPGAYTHYSYAIRDAIASVKIRAVEVHVSNVHSREEFRRLSVIAPVCAGTISGLGLEGYRAALRYLVGSAEDI